MTELYFIELKLLNISNLRELQWNEMSDICFNDGQAESSRFKTDEFWILMEWWVTLPSEFYLCLKWLEKFSFHASWMRAKHFAETKPFKILTKTASSSQEEEEMFFFFFKTCLRNTLWKSIVLMKCSVCHFWEQNILSDQNLKKFWSDILLSFTKLEGKNYIVISKFYKLVTKAEYFITKLAKYGTNANFQISIKCFALIQDTSREKLSSPLINLLQKLSTSS